MVKLYIFDFDGTLVDTLYDSVIAYNKALKKHGQPLYEYKSREDINFDEFINIMGSDEEVLETYKEIYINSPNENTIPYPGIKEILETLDKKSGCEIAICSNRIQKLLNTLTKKLFPDINFKYIIGHEIGKEYKPHPSMINQILNHEDIDNNEILYIGDRYTDILTAKNVNIPVAVVTWGQGDNKTYTDKYPVKIVNKAEEILEI